MYFRILYRFHRILLLLRSNPGGHHLKVLYRQGGQEKRKERKIWKSRSEEKVVGFSSPSLFSARKEEAVTQGKTI